MTPELAGIPPRFLRTPEAARFLGLSGRTLEKHRTYGTGPPYSKARRPRRLCDRGSAGLGRSRRRHLDLRSGGGTVLPAKRQSRPSPPRFGRSPLRRHRHVTTRRSSTRDASQLELVSRAPGDFAPRDAQDLMAYPFFSLAKSQRVAPIDFRAGRSTIRVEAVPEHGMATIWDADILIWAASQIVEARDAGLRTSRLMVATPYEILTFIGRGMSAARLRPPEGRARPAAVDDDRDLDPPADRTADAPLLLDQRMEGARRHARTSARHRTRSCPTGSTRAVLDDALVLTIDRAYFDADRRSRALALSPGAQAWRQSGGRLELRLSTIFTQSPAASRRSNTSPSNCATSSVASRCPATADHRAVRRRPRIVCPSYRSIPTRSAPNRRVAR